MLKPEIKEVLLELVQWYHSALPDGYDAVPSEDGIKFEGPNIASFLEEQNQRLENLVGRASGILVESGEEVEVMKNVDPFDVPEEEEAEEEAGLEEEPGEE
jgi:hypothetical protein